MGWDAQDVIEDLQHLGVENARAGRAGAASLISEAEGRFRELIARLTALEAENAELKEGAFRLLFAAAHLYNMRTREGWEDGPTLMESWSVVCDEVRNSIGECLDIGEWLYENQDRARRSRPFKPEDAARGEE